MEKGANKRVAQVLMLVHILWL